jgi:hypothetical protein
VETTAVWTALIESWLRQGVGKLPPLTTHSDRLILMKDIAINLPKSSAAASESALYFKS